MTTRETTTPHVLFVASECFPLIKTGGLADVVGALPSALEAVAAPTTVLLPGYPAVLKSLDKTQTLAKLKGFGKQSASLIRGTTLQGLDVIALDIPHLFKFEGNPYLDERGVDREDNLLRFSVFSKVAAELAAGQLCKGISFDVVHCHDWQAGLVPVYLHAMQAKHVKTVFTIHNLAFQGLFPSSAFTQLQLPDSYLAADGIEYWGQLSFMKGGLTYSDVITTVSPTYAQEIQSDEHGMGLGGLLRSRSADLFGILNGIDTEVWDPETDPALDFPFSARGIAGKAKNKRALQQHLNLRVDAKTPLFCVISRLTLQKGLDLLAEAVDHLVFSGAQLVLLGSGDAQLEEAFRGAAVKHPSEVSVTIGYDEPLAHRIQAAADAILIPSRFEPCGLTQLCAMRYGTVPVAGRVGGLNDTIINANPAALARKVATGILLAPVDTANLCAAITQSIQLYADTKAWAKIRRNCLQHPVDWQASAQVLADLYNSLQTAE